MSCLRSVGFCSKMCFFWQSGNVYQYDNFTFNRTHVLEAFFAQLKTDAEAGSISAALSSSVVFPPREFGGGGRAPFRNYLISYGERLRASL